VASASGASLSAANEVTGAVDGAAGDVGRTVDRPSVGDQAGGTVGRVRQRVLPSGAGGGLLGG
jgi:hypothetical protein